MFESYTICAFVHCTINEDFIFFLSIDVNRHEKCKNGFIALLVWCNRRVAVDRMKMDFVFVTSINLWGSCIKTGQHYGFDILELDLIFFFLSLFYLFPWQYSNRWNALTIYANHVFSKCFRLARESHKNGCQVNIRKKPLKIHSNRF